MIATHIKPGTPVKVIASDGRAYPCPGWWAWRSRLTCGTCGQKDKVSAYVIQVYAGGELAPLAGVGCSRCRRVRNVPMPKALFRVARRGP